jgi:hypothetical protein
MALRLTMMPDGDMANGRSGNGICLRHTTDRQSPGMAADSERTPSVRDKQNKWDVVELSLCTSDDALSALVAQIVIGVFWSCGSAIVKDAGYM